MIPGERMWTALDARRYLADLKDLKVLKVPIHPDQLKAAIAAGLPWHPYPFGGDRKVFYRSEIDEHLAKPRPEALTPTPTPAKRGPGRPRKPVLTTRRPHPHANDSGSGSTSRR